MSEVFLYIDLLGCFPRSIGFREFRYGGTAGNRTAEVVIDIRRHGGVARIVGAHGLVAQLAPGGAEFQVRDVA